MNEKKFFSDFIVTFNLREFNRTVMCFTIHIFIYRCIFFGYVIFFYLFMLRIPPSEEPWEVHGWGDFLWGPRSRVCRWNGLVVAGGAQLEKICGCLFSTCLYHRDSSFLLHRGISSVSFHFWSNLQRQQSASKND